jgi:hypothetical protein
VKILITGSREWTDYNLMTDELARVGADSPTIIHGCARGADRMAARIAGELGLEVEEFPPDPNLPSPQCYHARNAAMIAAQPDLVLAFVVEGGSKGADSVIERARRKGIPSRVITQRSFR